MARCKFNVVAQHAYFNVGGVIIHFKGLIDAISVFSQLKITICLIRYYVAFIYFLNPCDASPLGSLSSCCLQAQWHHRGSEPLGRSWQEGDVVGCLLDAAERTMMLTLNGELQFSSIGSELAAKDFDIMDGKNDVCCCLIIH